MNRNKLLIGLVVLLVILNLGLISFLWMGRPEVPHRRESGDRHQRVESYLKRKLDLTAGQIKAFEKQRKDHFRATSELMKAIQVDKRQMVNMLEQGKDSLEIEQVLQDINVKNNQLERLNFWHIRNLRDICNEKQKQKFDKIIYRIGEPQNMRRSR